MACIASAGWGPRLLGSFSEVPNRFEIQIPPGGRGEVKRGAVSVAGQILYIGMPDPALSAQEVTHAKITKGVAKVVLPDVKASYYITVLEDGSAFRIAKG